MNRLFLMTVVFGLFGCSHSTQELDPSLRHMLKSEKLYITMKKLDSIVYERQLSELDRDRARGRHVLDLATTLRSLSSELEAISQIDEQKDKIELYKSYAKLINTEAQALESITQNYTFEYLPQRVESIKNICNSCHAHFNVEHRK